MDIAPTDIAVIGMAGRFPKAPDLQAFWRNLADGVECIEHFDVDDAQVADAVRQHPDFVPARGILEDAADFDAGYFGMAPAEAKATDPQHRVLLEVAVHALENAAIDPERYPGAIGVFAGADINSYAVGHLLWTQDLQSLIGNDKDYLATRIAFKLDLRGPALTLQTACSTSLVAVVQAVQSLLSYQCDVALAGGVGIAFPQKGGYVFQEGGILSPDGHCRPFDANSKGTVGGDGCGLVVLKRLEDALDDGDPIRAVIKGAAINNDGRAKVGFTAPSVQGQAEVVLMAQQMGEVDPSTIGYIECHGTATQLGDPIEIAALTEVFREATDEVGFCRIGSVKSNMGHMNSAAGVGGFIKAVMALENRQIPPSLHFQTANPALHLDASPFVVADTLTPWTDRLRAGVSSFGVGGTNAHVVLEAAAPPMHPVDAGPWLLPVSAHTAEALDAHCAALADALDDTNLAAAAWTLQTGRRLHRHVRFVVADNADQARSRLASTPAQSLERDSRKLAFLFPGQGAQHVAMAEGLRDEPAFAQALDRCLAALDIPDDVWHDPERIQRTEYAQPLLFAVCWSLCELYASWGVQPDAVLGHSVGEYVAACRAGVFSVEDGLAMIAARGRLVQGMQPGAMLAVGLDESAARATGLEVAALNAPGVTVLSGTFDQVQQAEASLKAQGVASTRLHTSHAFHSVSMEPMLQDFRGVVAKVALSAPDRPIVSNLTGDWLTDDQATDPDYWVRHVRETVRFSQGLGLLAQDHKLVEVGPGRNLTGLAKKHGLDCTPSLRHPRQDLDDRVAVRQALGRLAATGTDIDWEALTGARPRIALPGTPFQRETYWQGFDASMLQLDSGGRQALEDQLYTAGWRSTPRTAMRSAPEGWSDQVPEEGPVKLLFFGTFAELVALVPTLSGREVELAIIGHGITGFDDVDLERVGLLPAASVLRQELGWSVRVIDLSPDTTWGPRCHGELWAEEPVVHRDRQVRRHVLEYHRVTEASLHESGQLGQRWLIVGGLGVAGLQLARGLAEPGRHLHLTSRSGLVARAEWDEWLRTHPEHDPISQRIRIIQEIEAAGATVQVHSADVCDRDGMQALAERIGAVDVALHCAGEGGARNFVGAESTTEAQLAAQHRARVEGLHVLVETVDAGRFVVTSSLSAHIGGVGLLAYAAANRAMEVTLSDEVVTSIAWDAFEPLSGRAAGALGALALSPQDARQLLERALRAVPRRLVVSTMDLETRVLHALQAAEASHRGGAVQEKHARPQLETDYEAPRTDTEKVVTEVWEDLFGIEPIGVNDNFFQLGGDSLMAIQLSTRLRDRLGVDLPVNDLFEEATIASVAARVERAQREAREQQAELENMLSMVESMSEEEVARLLAEMGG